MLLLSPRDGLNMREKERGSEDHSNKTPPYRKDGYDT